MLCLSVCGIPEAGVGCRHLKQLTGQLDAVVNTGWRPRTELVSGREPGLNWLTILRCGIEVLEPREKSQISAFHHLEVFILGTRKIYF